MDSYQPVACGLHSEYELAVMRGKPVRLIWLDDTGDEMHENVIPLDVYAREGEEFLKVEYGGSVVEIRLDRILGNYSA